MQRANDKKQMQIQDNLEVMVVVVEQQTGGEGKDTRQRLHSQWSGQTSPRR